MSDNEQPNKSKSWFERLSSILASEPQNKDDVLTLLQDAAEKELINPESLSMIEGVMQVSEMKVRDIMVPRSQMVVLNEGMSIDEILPIIIDSGHSRFPVIGETRDKVIGVLLAKDLLKYYSNNESSELNLKDQPFPSGIAQTPMGDSQGGEPGFSPLSASPNLLRAQHLYPGSSSQRELLLKDLIRPIVMVPESKRLNSLLKEFRDKHYHLAIIADEYGGIAGLVTIEDILEQIVGDIEDEYDIEEENEYIQPSGNPNEFFVNPLIPIENFNEFFQTNLSDEEFDTIGGLVLNELGHLPKENEEAIINKKFHFTVTHTDSRRIKQLRLRLM